MSEKIDNPSAFPPTGFPDKGMSLRDYFAGHAINGLIALQVAKAQSGLPVPQDIVPRVAQQAYEMADAMLEERAKK